MDEYQVGGGTIRTVDFLKTDYAEGPLRFEAGTPNIEGVVGMAEAIRYLSEIGMAAVSTHEHALLSACMDSLKAIPEIELYNDDPEQSAGVISFNMKGAHPFDVGTLLDKYGIAVRTGHHCTQPLMKRLSVPGTVRVSFALYNTIDEVEFFIQSLRKVIKMLK